MQDVDQATANPLRVKNLTLLVKVIAGIVKAGAGITTLVVENDEASPGGAEASSQRVDKFLRNLYPVKHRRKAAHDANAMRSAPPKHPQDVSPATVVLGRLNAGFPALQIALVGRGFGGSMAPLVALR